MDSQTHEDMQAQEVPPPEAPKELSGRQLKARQEAQNAAFRTLPKEQQRKIIQQQETVRRLINRGVPPDKVQEVMMKERLDAIPIKERVVKLEQLLSQVVRGFGEDLRRLQTNDKILAEALDTNFTAYSRLLVKAGITKEEQHAEIKQVERERAELRAAEAEKQKAATEETALKGFQKNVEAGASPDAPVELPEDARIFGNSPAPDSAEAKEKELEAAEG